MRTLSLAALFLASAALGLGARVPRAGHSVHEKRDVIPAAWSRSRKLEAERVLPMRFGLKQSNIDKLEEMLMDIAHPDSPNYGNHWSANKIAQTFAPSRESIETIKQWLIANGIEESRLRLSPSKGWIDFDATTQEMEDLLDAEYHVYTHEETGKEHICTPSSLICVCPVANFIFL